MDRTAILPLVLLITLLAVIANVSADEIKHKRVIVKVPKKINHVHHHHVKKIHVYKHKPKPIHSIHVVEEDEPIGKEWKSLFHGQRIKHSGHKGSFGYSSPFYGDEWKYEDGDEEETGYGGEEEEEEEEEEYHKSGSNNEPTVWRGKKNGGRWNDYRGGRTKGRTSWKDDRPKRHKYFGMNYRPEPNNRRPHTQKRPKKSSRNSKSKKSKKIRHARPVDKGYSDHGVQSDDEHFNASPIWPERKEHISWHMRQNNWPLVPVVPFVTESPHYVVEDYQSEHKGEINLVKPDIKEVQAPQLGPKLVKQEPQLRTKQFLQEQTQPWTKELAHQPLLSHDQGTDFWLKEFIQQPQLWTREVVQKPQEWPKPIVEEPLGWSKPVIEVPQVRPNPVVQEPSVRAKPEVIESHWTKPAVQETQWTKPVIQEQQWKVPEIQEQVLKKPKVKVPKKTVREHAGMKKPAIQENNDLLPKRLKGFRTEVEHSGTGYSSHVGHTAEGDSASFQSVRFGEKIKVR